MVASPQFLNIVIEDPTQSFLSLTRYAFHLTAISIISLNMNPLYIDLHLEIKATKKAFTRFHLPIEYSLCYVCVDCTHNSYIYHRYCWDDVKWKQKNDVTTVARAME